MPLPLENYYSLKKDCYHDYNSCDCGSGRSRRSRSVIIF